MPALLNSRSSRPNLLSISDRKSTRLNSSHTEIYTLSLHDALPIYGRPALVGQLLERNRRRADAGVVEQQVEPSEPPLDLRSEEHTSELQSHRDLHSFPTRRSSDLRPSSARRSTPRAEPEARRCRRC